MTINIQCDFITGVCEGQYETMNANLIRTSREIVFDRFSSQVKIKQYKICAKKKC